MAGSDTCEGSPPYLYARPPAKEMFQKVPGIPVAAHCVRPLRSAYPIIRIIRHGLGKKQPRLPSLSLLHNMNYVNFTQCSQSHQSTAISGPTGGTPNPGKFPPTDAR